MGPTAAFIAGWLAFASSMSGLQIPSGARPSVSLAKTFHGTPLGLNTPYVGFTDTTKPTAPIVLYAGWTGRSTLDSCVMAHEATHWLQVVNHVGDHCPEPVAYFVTAACYYKLGDEKSAQHAFSQAMSIGCGS